MARTDLDADRLVSMYEFAKLRYRSASSAYHRGTWRIRALEIMGLLRERSALAYALLANHS